MKKQAPKPMQPKQKPSQKKPVQTREDVEALLMEKAREIRDILKGYAPDSMYFDLCIMSLNRVSINNNYWESDRPLKITSQPLDGEEADD